MTTNTKNSFTRFAAAAKDCFYVNSFRADLVQCDRALKMDGEMHVEAECWMNILDALDDNDIKMYTAKPPNTHIRCTKLSLQATAWKIAFRCSSPIWKQEPT